VTLHHTAVYIQVGQFGMSSGHGILIRTCKGRKDHTGGANHFVGLRLLDDIPALAAAVRAITGVGPIGSNSKDDQASCHQAETVSAAGARSRRHHSATANLEGRP
jgi:hypothetical protein